MVVFYYEQADNDEKQREDNLWLYSMYRHFVLLTSSLPDHIPCIDRKVANREDNHNDDKHFGRSSSGIQLGNDSTGIGFCQNLAKKQAYNEFTDENMSV